MEKGKYNRRLTLKILTVQASLYDQGIIRGNELENESEVHQSIISDQSSDLGEIERERVRQVFQEWMSTGVMDHSQSSSVSHKNYNCSRAPWLGGNERERVRIIKEWVQINIQQGGAGSPRDEGAANIGSQYEQVRDGFSVNHSENGDRKPVRVYCGRQAFLDLLMKFQSERKKEIQGLLECKPVSNFTYRNRIQLLWISSLDCVQHLAFPNSVKPSQSLLKGRFLRNERLMTSDERTTSHAASELGLLRQNHTVSDLRKEILSRLVNNARGSAKDMQLNASSKDDLNHHRSEQSQSNNEQEIIDEFYDKYELDNKVRGTDLSHVVAEHSDQIRGNEDIEQETSNLEFIGSVPERENNGIGNLAEESANEWLQEIAAVERGSQYHVPEDREPFHDNDARRSEASDTHEVYDHSHGLTRSTLDDYEWQVLLAQAEEPQDVLTDHEESNLRQLKEPDELVIEHDESEQPSASEHNETADYTTEDMSGSSEHDTGEQIYEQEQHEDSQSNALEGEIDDWLDIPSGQSAGSMRRVDSFYVPDDDNVYSIELQELLSRRRVSNLLQSGFRESLDQIIQSHVERQGQDSDWDMDETSSYPEDMEHELPQENDTQDGHQINSGANPFPMTSLQVAPSRPLWDLDPDDQNIPLQYPWQCIGTDWEIIHELRNDVSRLQQRMDNMQRMFKKCMEMQAELQRAVHQDVSAALNRYAYSTDIDACEGSLRNDEPKWDKVRKGICCLCCNSSIDTLLYRCGHMCTCLKCAEKLVQWKGKCPMCRAPVVEVIRAFPIQ